MQFKALADNLGLEEDDFMEMVELFVETSNTDFSELKKAAASNDLDGIVQKAHSIKGASGNMGFTETYESARTIEDAARNAKMENIGDHINELETLLEAIESQYRSFPS